MIQRRIFRAGLAKSPSLPSARNAQENCRPSERALPQRRRRRKSYKQHQIFWFSIQSSERISLPCSCVLFWQSLCMKIFKAAWVCMPFNTEKLNLPVFYRVGANWEHASILRALVLGRALHPLCVHRAGRRPHIVPTTSLPSSGIPPALQGLAWEGCLAQPRGFGSRSRPGDSSQQPKLSCGRPSGTRRATTASAAGETPAVKLPACPGPGECSPNQLLARFNRTTDR